MNKLSKTSLKLQEAAGNRQLPRELSETEIGQVAGGVSCSWYEVLFGWITHAGYPPEE